MDKEGMPMVPIIDSDAKEFTTPSQGCSAISWRDLPRDIVEEIAQKIFYHADLCHFCSICKPWRAIVKEKFNHIPFRLPMCHCLPGQLPLLMHSYNIGATDSVDFLCLSDKNIYGDFFLPELKNRVIKGSSQGWFVTVDIQTEKSYLLNPLTRAQKQLPSINYFLPSSWSYDETEEPPETFKHVYKVILSSDPRFSDCIVMTIGSLVNTLSFCRVGDDCWTKIKDSPTPIDDVIYYKGKFYAIDHCGALVVFDCPSEDAKVTIVAGRTDSEALQELSYPSRKYLAESSKGGLLVVVRHAGCEYLEDEKIFNIKTLGFDVFKLKLGPDNSEEEMLPNIHYRTIDQRFPQAYVNSEWVKLDSLGDEEMIFLGINHSFSIPSDASSSCRGNCIYFTTEDLKEDLKQNDIGIYDMESRTILPYEPDDPHCFVPPVWFQPNP